MSRSNYDKPFYVDVGTSIVAVRCASNHDVVLRYDHSLHPFVIKLAEDACDRMNKEAEIGKPLRQCDVGTAEEQVERFKEFCQSNMQYYRDMFGTHDGAGGYDCREDCPIGKMIDKNDSLCDHCQLLWAQMPYEEGGDSSGN